MIKQRFTPLLAASLFSLSACAFVTGPLETPKPAPSAAPVASVPPTAATASASLSAAAVPTGSPAAVLAPLQYPAEHPVPFAVVGDYLGIRSEDGYKPIYIKGINLGIGMPGTAAGDLAASREQYARWFQRMIELGFNTLRIYTLHYPHFYEELARFNAAHPKTPLYLLHGVWLDDHEANRDLHSMTKHFDDSLKEVVDAVHGNIAIDHRFGRAHGEYKANISRWVLGWVIGREVMPEEVLATNASQPDRTHFQGKILRLPRGNPTEVWFTERLDNLLHHERSQYKEERPISVSSWPTLDPLTHPTENPKETQEDIATFDMAQLDVSRAPAGYFASFHAYPYYPNFMNDEPAYTQFSDRQGPNNYLGYLHALKTHYRNMPVLIAEYGVPTSWGNAHYSLSGMHHGGHDEAAQGKFNARMTRNIYESKSAGGVLFAWIDEWWKRTWIVDEISLPRERYSLWHNITSPEENFGLIAFEPKAPEFQTLATNNGRVRKIEAGHDPRFFHFRVSLASPLANGETVYLALNTYRDDLGETVLPNGVKTFNRNEFVLEIKTPFKAQLHATEAYDLYGIWHKLEGPGQRFRSMATAGAPWVPVQWINSSEHTSADGALKFPMTLFPIGQLMISNQRGEPSSLNAVTLDDTGLSVKMPWTLINFTDPSTRSVMHDDRDTVGVRETFTSDGIAVSVSLGGELVESGRYRWQPWEKVLDYTEREKASVPAMQEIFKQIPDTP